MAFNCISLALLSYLILFASLSLFSHATDTLKPGQSLQDGETLISAGEMFELGFFRPGKSSNRYVGIWYRFSIDTVLWVANRESPITDNSGSVAIGHDGNLVVLDGTKSIIWSSKTSMASNDSLVRLTDSGNLELIDSSGSVAWQSFDHPTDTYMPGMKAGLDLRTHVNQKLTSWTSEDDPAPGNFSLGMDPSESTQIYMWEGTKPRWRSGRWDQQTFIGIQNMVPTYVYGFRLSNFQQEQKMYFYYNALNNSPRYVLTWDGIMKHMIWRNDTKDWYQYWAQPVTDCEIYNTCGKYGSCTDGATPICSCLKGFVPASSEEWSKGNWSSGCTRRTPLGCGRGNSSGEAGGDGFWRLGGVNLPDISDWNDGVDINGCEERCLRNCSCTAYAFVTGIGCLIWGVDLLDIHIFSSGGNDLYLRLAGSELDKKNNKTFIIIIVTVTVVLSLGCIYLLWKCKNRIKELFKQRLVGGRGLMDSTRGQERLTDYSDSTGNRIGEEGSDGKCPELSLWSFDSVVAATKSFSSSNFIGEGGFGPVFKGILPEGQEIAVKRLSRSSMQGLNELKNEVMLIAKLQHRNLVRLLGCCIQEEEKILIYEYLPNKSLDAFLFDPIKRGLLDWKTRYNIIEGIARGLVYLHRDSRLRVIHRDLKPSNILLDEDMNPKISDFGMARIFGNDENETNTKRLVGTFGYMSPEYAMQGLFSVKSDVYSFGVLLLEIVGGSKCNTFRHPELAMNLIAYAWKLWNEDRVMEFVDPTISDSCSRREVSRCINVGLLCVQDRPNDRPNMASVVIMLGSEIVNHPLPRRPMFTVERNFSETDSSTIDLNVMSANASITMLQGR